MVFAHIGNKYYTKYRLNKYYYIQNISYGQGNMIKNVIIQIKFMEVSIRIVWLRLQLSFLNIFLNKIGFIRQYLFNIQLEIHLIYYLRQFLIIFFTIFLFYFLILCTHLIGQYEQQNHMKPFDFIFLNLILFFQFSLIQFHLFYSNLFSYLKLLYHIFSSPLIQQYPIIPSLTQAYKKQQKIIFVTQIVIKGNLQINNFCMINNLRKQQKSKINTVYHNYNLSTKNFDGKLLYQMFLTSGHIKKRDIKFHNPDLILNEFRSVSKKSSRVTLKSQSHRNLQSQSLQKTKKAVYKMVQSQYERGRHTTQLTNIKQFPQQVQRRQNNSVQKIYKTMYKSMQSKNSKMYEETLKSIKFQRLNLSSATNKKKRLVSAKKQKVNLEDFLIAENIQADPWVQGKMGGFSAEYISVMGNGKRIYSFEGDKMREIASLTKIMTCITALYLAKKYEIDIKNQQVKVSRRSAMLIGTSAGLMAGDIIKMNDLLYGMMLPSGNDAAQALADFFCRFIQQKTKQQEKSKIKNEKQGHKKLFQQKNNLTIDSLFIKQMNNLACHLKMKNTHFDNPHGLSNKNNYSSANDMVELCHYSMKNPSFRQIVKCKQHECKIFRSYQKMNKIVKWTNTNKLLSLDHCEGIKTGITPTAGPCMAASFQKDGFLVIIVILNAKNKSKRFLEVKNLYQWASQQAKS